MFDFQRLKVYSKAKAFHANVSKTILNQRDFKPHVKDQLGRASMSIILNIAEGTSRFTNPSKKNFYVIARGSVFECVAGLEILKDQKMITKETYDDFFEQADELSRMIFGMIRNLER